MFVHDSESGMNRLKQARYVCSLLSVPVCVKEVELKEKDNIQVEGKLPDIKPNSTSLSPSRSHHWHVS